MRVGRFSKVFFEDCMDVFNGIPSIHDESVALAFTSPPYFNYIEYPSGGVGSESDYSDYLRSLDRVIRHTYRKIMVGGRFVINVSNMKSRRAVEGDSFVYHLVGDIVRIFRAAGFTLFDEMIWDKTIPATHTLGGKVLFGSYPDPPTPKMLDSMFENILVFIKPGKRPKVDESIKKLSRLTKEEWREFTKGIWRIRTDATKGHPATFPMELAERVVRLYSFVTDVVIDPFVGSGTTVIAAEKWGRRGIGWEISGSYAESIENKAKKHLKGG